MSNKKDIEALLKEKEELKNKPKEVDNSQKLQKEFLKKNEVKKFNLGKFD